MQFTVEKSLREFDFWSGAKNHAQALTWEELNTMETVLEELYPDGCTETQINDIFWFEPDWIAECLGYSDWEELEEDR